MERRKRSSQSSSKMQYQTEAYKGIEGRRHLTSLSNNGRKKIVVPFNNECNLNAFKELEPGITSHLKEVLNCMLSCMPSFSKHTMKEETPSSNMN